ncbi:signal recognition particle, SRP9/SRP14 subunit [Globomyces pollinis-pini]|nr:signal recognition particle, SRP9/SRP14 subunit [Globomyces pollinis-pini]
MVYITLWDDYQQQVEDLYQNSPIKTRYVIKYRNCDGKLVFKVTDDRKCLKFKTDKLQDMNKFERLNLSMMSRMQGRIHEPMEEVVEEKVIPVKNTNDKVKKKKGKK